MKVRLCSTELSKLRK